MAGLGDELLLADFGYFFEPVERCNELAGI
jgi:hypothetical protein